MASDVQPGPETTSLVIGTGVSPHEKVGFPIQDRASTTTSANTRPFELGRAENENQPGGTVTDNNKDLNSNAQKNSGGGPLDVPPIIIRPPRKRRHSSSLPPPSDHTNVPKFSSPQQVRKRRRTAAGSFQNMKFLLGGNSTDPLNLNSLVTGDPNAPIVSPYCSPAPSRNKDSVPVIIPQDITDPLNLKSGEDADDNVLLGTSFTEPKSGNKRKKRHHSHRKKSSDAQKKDVSSDFTSDSSEIEKSDYSERELPSHLDLNKQNHRQDKSQTQRADKIVSPVLDAFDDTSPRGRQRKRKPEVFTSKVSRALLRTDSVQAKEDPQVRPPSKPHHRRQDSSELKIQPKCKGKDKLFKYGNYNQYYGKRNCESEPDARLKCFNTEWFKNKDVLDIGCNIGHVTITLARDFEPNRIIGVDIDGNLISIARKNVRHYLSPPRSFLGEKFPVSADRCQGPISAPPLCRSGTDQSSRFPHNVAFKCCNYVLDRDDLLTLQKPEYDVILCLSVTKWVHLNWGDAGIKRLFKRIYLQLRPGGRFILEPQSWQSYARKKKLTETIRHNYNDVRLKPEQFTEYLLSKEVGFTTCEMLDTPAHPAKGFQRPILMFRKSHKTTSQSDSHTNLHSTASKHDSHVHSRHHYSTSRKDRHREHHCQVENKEAVKEHCSEKKDDKTREHHCRVDKEEVVREPCSEKKDDRTREHHCQAVKEEAVKEYCLESKDKQDRGHHRTEVKEINVGNKASKTEMTTKSHNKELPQTEMKGSS